MIYKKKYNRLNLRCSGERVGGMLFADDFVGISDSKESLRKRTDAVYQGLI